MKRLLILLLLGFVAGCGPEPSPPAPKKIKNVVKVFCHRPGKYTFMTKVDGQLLTYNYMGNWSTFVLMCDVPPKEPMWALVEGYPSQERVTIHIHDPDDLGGGGWDDGKFGSGRTTVVE